MQSLWAHLTGNAFIGGLSLVAAGLLIHFLWQYVGRGILLRRQLKRIARGIRGLERESPEELRSKLRSLFAGTDVQHAWKEFDDTLHEQFEFTGGERQVRDIRATLPAEAFINLETTVDSRIGTEYFRHLPGLFTGLGIVGTFTGLIQGLLGFKPDVETEALKGGLAELFRHVQEAFFFSAVAIGLAMLVTLVEKWLYSSCAKWVGEITTSLDALFRAGVGEEYLSGLLQASQENATQTRQLKESMVDDLKVLLTNLTERQIEATHQLSADLGRSIEGSLKEPLASLAETVRQASGQQTHAASNALENLMSAFMAQMRETLGGQLGDLSALMQQTAQSMTQVEAAMRALVGDMQRASTESTSSMQASVQELIQSMANYQRQQSDAVNSSASGLLEKVEATVTRLAEHNESMATGTRSAMDNVVGAMESKVAAMAQASQQSSQATAEAIASLGQVSNEAITGMGQGAAAVSAAVGAVHQATERLGDLARQMASMQSGLLDSAQQLTQSSGVIGAASQSLVTATTALGGATGRLENVAQIASAEAEARSQLLADLKAMTEQSRGAGRELASLSEEVQTILAQNVDSFGNGVSKVLSQHLADYQKQLGDAVGMLRLALEELAEVAVETRA